MTARQDRFPARFFALLFFYYMAQGIFTPYINLYLAQTGLSNSAIGLIVSVSTLVTLVAQLALGAASDRARYKNTIVTVLFLASAAVGLLFYLGSGFWLMLGLVTLFNAFFCPLMSLQDNLALEALEGGRWGYGRVRMGGTIGYCLAVLVTGVVLQNRYGNIFWMTSVAALPGFFISLRLPKVRGHRSAGQKSSWLELVKNRPLMVFFAFNLLFSLGLNFFYNFYPIYFVSLGASSATVGVMLFVCALSEIPVLAFADRVIKKLGVGNVLVIAGLVTALRWGLLYLLKAPALIIAVSALHGMGFIGVSYSIITYINQTVPKDLRATSQVVNGLISTILAKAVFGFISGWASEKLGTANLVLFAGAVIAAGTLALFIWTRRHPAVNIPNIKNGQ